MNHTRKFWITRTHAHPKICWRRARARTRKFFKVRTRTRKSRVFWNYARSDGLTKQENDSKRNECALSLLIILCYLQILFFLYYILFNVAACVYFSNRMIVVNFQLARIRIGLVARWDFDLRSLNAETFRNAVLITL